MEPADILNIVSRFAHDVLQGIIILAVICGFDLSIALVLFLKFEFFLVSL